MGFIMKEKYKNYLDAFNNLDIDEKKEFILSLVKEMLVDAYKINNMIGLDTELFDEYYETDDEFLNLLFNYLVNLKDLTEDNMDILKNE